MVENEFGGVAILYPGNPEVRQNATTENNRFSELFKAFAARGVHAVPAVYHDDFHNDVYEQLMQVDCVLVWVNPLEGKMGRSVLDSMLRDVAAAGIFVSTHPDIILKLGTKEVLYHTRNIGWGCDTHLYKSMEQMRQELPQHLADGKARVIKQYRGNGGIGVWKVQAPMSTISHAGSHENITLPQPETIICAHHARRGSFEEEMTLEDFYGLCAQYFTGNGRLIDQEYQERLPEGMIRCYLTHDKVNGFGHQAVNALFPAPPGTPPTEAPQPGPRLYHPPTREEYQLLKQKLEQDWIPAVQQLLEIDTKNLPILWDCDFLLGPKAANGEDTYVLCEINVSSVAPFPDSAVAYVVDATMAQLQAAQRRRGH